MKKVIFVLPVLHGGGAERVATQIANTLRKRNDDVTFVLTSDTTEEAVRADLLDSIPLVFIQDSRQKEPVTKKLLFKLFSVFSSLLCKSYEWLKKPVPALFAMFSFRAQYHYEIAKVKQILMDDPDAAIISFLQPSIPVVIMAAKGLHNRIIISERGNPNRLLGKRYGRKFIEKHYTRADAVVFQTEAAKAVYPEVISKKGTVIPNPIKNDLPKSYHGLRNKTITTFCRIHPDKDLLTLLKAFSFLYQGYPAYRLKIIGDAKTPHEIQYQQELLRYIQANGLEKAVDMQPFSHSVHQDILHDAMYVNSSVTEGLCNAMLEAMAIGLPVVCTDCPIGGARDTIQNGVNGLLVPVQDDRALFTAMKRLISDKELSDRVSKNAAEIRNKLDLDKIAEQWEKLIL